MSSQLAGFFLAVGTVTLAEMGDKTQLLAMAFAAKYKASRVMLGVFVATVANHALAVAVGNMLAHWHNAAVWISGAAALSFIGFGLWTIRGDRLDDEAERSSRHGAVLTVAIAFFVAELGDKTQLATIALATRFPSAPVAVLMGTTTGMMIADGLGIVIGALACKRIPERMMKLISAAVFIIFGLFGLYQVGVNELKLNLPMVWTSLLVIAAGSGWGAWMLWPAEVGQK